MDDNKTTTNLDDAGRQIPSRPHDAGSGANETPDGLDASNEALRNATENAPPEASPADIELLPVFDRAGLASKI